MIMSWLNFNYLLWIAPTPLHHTHHHIHCCLRFYRSSRKDYHWFLFHHLKSWSCHFHFNQNLFKILSAWTVSFGYFFGFRWMLSKKLMRHFLSLEHLSYWIRAGFCWLCSCRLNSSRLEMIGFFEMIYHFILLFRICFVILYFLYLSIYFDITHSYSLFILPFFHFLIKFLVESQDLQLLFLAIQFDEILFFILLPHHNVLKTPPASCQHFE